MKQLLVSISLLLSLAAATRVMQGSGNDLLSRTYVAGPDVRQREINAILQSRDGYVWIATQKGLLRFDGVNLTAFTSENTPGIVRDDFGAFSMWEAKDGSLWFGTGRGGAVRESHGFFSSVGLAQGLRSPTITRLDGDATGAIWIYSYDMVSRWKDGSMERQHPERFGGGVGHMIPRNFHRTEDFDGLGLWRRTPHGVERFAFGEWKPFPTPAGESRPFEEDVARIYEDNLHRVWYSVLSQPGRYFCVQDNQLRSFDGLPANALVSYQDTSGFLWLNTPDSHPARWKDGNLYPLPQMSTPSYLRVLEEPDGTFIVGSHRTALYEFRPKLIQTISTPGAVESEPVLYRQTNGAVWVGGTTLSRANLRGSEVELQPTPQKQKTGDRVMALSEDHEHRLLIAMQNQRTLMKLQGGELRALPRRHLDDSAVRAMLLSSSGDQWAGTRLGLYRFRDAWKQPTELVWKGQVNCLYETPWHQILVGSDQGLLAIHDVFGKFKATTLWSGDVVFAIQVKQSGEVWLSTSEQGIVRLNKSGAQSFGTAAGLPTNRVYSATFDDAGDLWLRTDVGLIRVRGKSLDGASTAASSKLQFIVLGQNDGLPVSVMDAAGEGGYLRLPLGTLWFSTSAGIASLKPESFVAKEILPEPVIEEHSVDQSSLRAGLDFSVLPGQSDLEIHYTALRSRRPEEVNFRYKLEGFDARWIPAGHRRAAYYTHLPPGRYSFQVEASNGDSSEWVRSAAVAHVIVQTPFYRTWWAKLLALAASAAFGFYLIDRRRRANLELGRVRQAFTHQLIAAQEHERKRLASDLHDSVGQQLALIQSSASVQGRTSDDRNGSSRLAVIAGQAADALREVKHLSYDLRPYQLDRLGLTKAVADLLRRLRIGTDVLIVEEIDEVDGFFTPDLEINVYRIIQESVSNALRHARPSKISVFVWRDGESLRLVVEDNGSGFSSEQQASTHGLGLIGIRERADVLGGRAKITSTPGQGTRVEVDIRRGHAA